MPKWLQLSNGTAISIYDTPFASGGEGDLFAVYSGNDAGKIVVKIYRPEKRSHQKEKKLSYLIQNPPRSSDSSGHAYIVWPKSLVYDQGLFVGFTMPLATGEKLEFLCHPKLPKRLAHTWSRFAFSETGVGKLRLKICYNIAVAIHHLHANGNYVLTDLKPDNIMIQPTGLISIIDTDSVTVNAKDGTRFLGPVATPDYTPPEYYRGVNPELQPIPMSWDLFSLGILFYRLLCGIHPYSGTCKAPFDRYNSVHELIEKGLFPHSPSKGNYFQIVPPPHLEFQKMPSAIQKLFLQCFEAGHTDPERRPNTNDWCQALSPIPIMVVNRKSVLQDLPTLVFKPLVIAAGVAPLPLQRFHEIKQALAKITPNTTNNADYQLARATINRILLLENEWNRLWQNRQQTLAQNHQKYGQLFTEKQQLLAAHKQRLEQEAQQAVEEETQKLQGLYTHRLMTADQIERQFVDQVRVELKPIHELYLPQSQAVEDQIQRLNSAYKDAVLAKENRLDQWMVAIASRVKKEEQKLYDKFEKEYQLQYKKLQAQKKKILADQKKETNAAQHQFYANAIYDQLAQFKIYDAAVHLFNDKYANMDDVILALAYQGIVTAADFSLINDLNSTVLNKHGNWVKIPGLGPQRAKKLAEWRTKLIRSMNQSTAFQPASAGELSKIQKKYEDKLYYQELEERKLWTQLQKNRATIPNLLSRLYHLAKNKEQLLKREHEKSIAIMNQKYYPKIQKAQLKLSKLTQQYQKKLESTRKKVEKALKQEKAKDQILKNFEAEKNKIQLHYDLKQDTLHQSYQKMYTTLRNELQQYQQNWELRQKDGTTPFDTYQPTLRKEYALAEDTLIHVWERLKKS